MSSNEIIFKNDRMSRLAGLNESADPERLEEERVEDRRKKFKAFKQEAKEAIGKDALKWGFWRGDRKAKKVYKAMKKSYKSSRKYVEKGGVINTKNMDDSFKNIENSSEYLNSQELTSLAKMTATDLKIDTTGMSDAEVTQGVLGALGDHLEAQLPDSAVLIPGDKKYYYVLYKFTPEGGEEGVYFQPGSRKSGKLFGAQDGKYKVKRGGKLEVAAKSDERFKNIPIGKTITDEQLQQAMPKTITKTEYGKISGKYMMNKVKHMYGITDNQKALELAKAIAAANNVNANSPYAEKNELQFPEME